jgi:hypothetical protein
MQIPRITRRARRALALSAAVAAGSVCSASSVLAAPTAPSIAIKFGTDQPGRPGDTNGAVTGPAGVLNTVVWNNFAGQNSAAPQSLNADVAGVSNPTAATVSWTSNNTWSSTGAGEENNTGTGENGDLMGGYLDTGGLGGTPVTVTVTNLPAVAGFPYYNVYVYTQGGVNGRGGTYTLGPLSKEHTGDSAFAGTFVEDTLDPGTTPGSNYLVFRGLNGSGFTLTGTPTIGNPARAPINAIEIVAVVPEPAGMALLGVAAAGLLGRRRRAR